LYQAKTTNKLLKAKASNEIEWINKIYSHANGNIAIIPWIAEEIKGEKLNQLLL
jgi:arsenite-transporting ATPase